MKTHSNDPIVAAALAALARLAPADAREEIVGDLRDEWCEVVVPERGAGAARAWLVRQAIASAPPLLALRWRRGELQPRLAVAAAAGAGALAAFAAVDALWHVVLSLVPLRAHHAPGLAWIAAQIVSMAALGFVAGGLAAWLLVSRRRVPS